jgi:hypothetical protein
MANKILLHDVVFDSPIVYNPNEYKYCSNYIAVPIPAFGSDFACSDLKLLIVMLTAYGT